MFRNFRTFRWLLTAVLAFSTSVAGLLPQMAGTAPAGERTLSQESPAQPCCCGTKQGACCGMGCCTAREAPAPAQSPAPLHEDGFRGGFSPLGLVWNRIDLLRAARDQSAWNCDGDVAVRSSAEATLQTLHVRLDV